MDTQCEHFESPPISGRDLYYYYPDGIEAGFLCEHCAIQAGFCPGCGKYVAGNWDFAYIQESGLCGVCMRELDQVIDDLLGEDD